MEPSAAKSSTGSTNQASEQSKTVSSSDSGPKSDADEKTDVKGPAKDVATTKEDPFGDEIRKLKALHEKFQKRSRQMKDKQAAAGHESDVPDLPPSMEVSSKPAPTTEIFPEVECPTSEIELVQEEVLESPDDDPLFVRYDYVNRRYESDVDRPASEDLDMEDIDKELEMALVRHKVREIARVSF